MERAADALEKDPRDLAAMAVRLAIIDRARSDGRVLAAQLPGTKNVQLPLQKSRLGPTPANVKETLRRAFGDAEAPLTLDRVEQRAVPDPFIAESRRRDVGGETPPSGIFPRQVGDMSHRHLFERHDHAIGYYRSVDGHMLIVVAPGKVPRVLVAQRR